MLCYLQFFLHYVARHLDHFHTVDKSGMDAGGAVGRRYEQHIREVVVDIKIVVVESHILFRVKNFKQRRHRVAAKVVGLHLVDLVEHKNGVADLGLHHTTDDAARHSTHVGAAMAADFGLVVDTAQSHTHILAAQSRSDGFAQRGLARSRSAHKAQHRRLALVGEVEHSHHFQHTLFHLFKSEMIAVQTLASLIHIRIETAPLAPRQVEHHRQIVKLKAIVGRSGIGSLQLFRLVFEMAGHLFAPLHFLGTRAQILDVLFVRRPTKFLLNDVHLLVQEILALLFLHRHTCLVLYFATQGLHRRKTAYMAD